MSEYFPHDYSARNDVKLKKLLMRHGVAGIGIYWCIIEMLYESGGRLPDEAATVISFDLRVEEQLINSVIDDFELFGRGDGDFFSQSVLRRLGDRAERSEKARQSISARWSKYERNTNVSESVIRRPDAGNTHSNTEGDGEYYGESESVILKRKENKRKENKNIYCAFFDSVWDLYPSKKGKAAVTNKALKEMQEAGEDVVRAALQQYIATKPDWQHWMNGSTFFNGRWRDYVGEPSSGSATDKQAKTEKPFDKFIPDGVAQGSEEEYVLVEGRRYNRWGQELNDAGYPIIDFGIGRFGCDF